jgi:hypothetical protein
MHPVEIKTRDGLNMVSYLTLPPGSDADGDGKPDKPVPMVLLVHGGPWGRDTYGYNGYHQWLANRGYAVLSPNFRASTGFGKKFISAGDLQWGRKMHDDLLDAVDWAVAAGHHRRQGRDHGRLLRRLCDARRPDLHAGQVRLRRRHRRAVEPQHPARHHPAYWEALKTSAILQADGRSEHAEGKALLRERSPLFKADRSSGRC